MSKNLGTTFPKVTICSHSMHSKHKLAKYYPQINDSMLMQFYGKAQNLKVKNEWNKLAALKVKQINFRSRKNQYNLDL